MATNLIESKSAIEAINKLKSVDPPQFLSPNSDLSLTSRLASQNLFTFLKNFSPKSPFDQLLVDGFDAEQIWQQIDIQSQPLINLIKREIRGFEKNPDKISNIFKNPDKRLNVQKEKKKRKDESLSLFEEFEEDEDVGLEGDSEDDGEDEDDSESGNEDGDEDEEFEDDGDGVPEVEDDFLKIKELEKFLVREEKKEFGANVEKVKKKKSVNDKFDDDDDDDEESESDEEMKNADTNELLMYGGDDDDEDGADYRYEDFYLPNKKTPKSRVKQVDESDDLEMEGEKNNVSKTRKKQVDELDESDALEIDNGDDDEEESSKGKNLSTHEKEREKLQAKIKQMEEANLSAKDWTMQGEITASKRPRDSALEVDLDFEHNVRPPPVITEEVTASLEDIIKKRISEGRFDDVQKAPKLTSSAPKERKELDDNKSKKGLAEIYEEEYAKQTGLDTAPLSHNDELRKEASVLFKRICLKLDALSHFHFAPKPVVEDMSIQTNVPALAIEEVAPLAVSDAAMLAPEEVFAGKGDIKEDTELTKEDRKKNRASMKRKFKAVNAARTTNQTAGKTLQNNAEGKEL